MQYVSDESSDESDYSSDETSESLLTTIIQEIQNGTYTCLVCTGEIDLGLRIWSCESCYRVYDLECIQDWATRGSSTNKTNRNWRCPSCNVETTTIPRKFTCWCGRVENPLADALVPFSCENACGEPYADCVHSCPQVCHPGKHPVCGAMGPVLKCKCGKCVRQLPCLITPYEEGWNCDVACDTQLCDLGHKCPQACHAGFCGACVETVRTRCYCGKYSLQVACQDRVPKECYNAGEQYIGGTACAETTVRYYDCGVHFEELGCEPQAPTALACKFAPAAVALCYCGKSSRASSARTKCTDPMPECDAVCGKLLACGCKCRAKCHAGACVCYNFVDATCACGHHTYVVPCKFLQEGRLPKCTHKCGAIMNCRTHYHRAVCCPDEPAAARRERDRKKHLRNKTRASVDDDLMTIEPVHICMRTCNRLKLCGRHYCDALCHAGNCGVCLELSNEDLVCDCGKTVIPAPVRCGTRMRCTYQCAREPACGHRLETHACHDDDAACPKCTVLVTRLCRCGRQKVSNVLCYQTDVSCGLMCSTRKECGHACARVCVRACVEGTHAPIEDCKSLCRKLRASCPHYCKRRCHAGAGDACDTRPCADMVTVSCACGRISHRVACGALAQSALRIGLSLECDDACAQERRGKELQSALALSPAQKNPYTTDVSSVYRRQATWCAKYEAIIRDFVSDYVDVVASGGTPQKTMHLPPMTKPQRGFIHALAAIYHLYSDLQDSEPNRTVFLVITDATEVPEITIKQALVAQEEEEVRELQESELKQMQLDEAYFNAIVIQDVFFGIIREDIEVHTNEILRAFNLEEPILQWIKESTYIFYSKSDYTNMDVDRENSLYLLMKAFKKTLRDKLIAFDCKLCMVNDAADAILKVDEKNIISTKNESKKESADSNIFSILGEIDPV